MTAPITRILCPVDFSLNSTKALRYAERLAVATGASLIVAHAFDMPAGPPWVDQTDPADRGQRTQLEQLAVAPEVQVTRVLHAGLPGEVICWLAQEHQCDLIVLGTHGRTGLTHLLLGSVAEYVMKHARSPVLTVRDRPADEPPLEEPVVLPPRAPRLM